MSVVIMPKFFQLPLQVAGVPEECMVKIFTANGPDQPFEDAKIRLPAVIPEQWVIVRTEVVRNTLSRNGCVEQATQGDTVHITSMHTRTNNTPRELVHDYEHPVAFQKNGFTPKQINAPKAVLGVPEEG